MSSHTEPSSSNIHPFTSTGFTSAELLQIKILLLRNKFYKENPLLKKENFTAEDEIEIEKFLKRTKHPLMLKYQKVVKLFEESQIYQELKIESAEDCTNLAILVPPPRHDQKDKNSK